MCNCVQGGVLALRVLALWPSKSVVKTKETCLFLAECGFIEVTSPFAIIEKGCKEYLVSPWVTISAELINKFE